MSLSSYMARTVLYRENSPCYNKSLLYLDDELNPTEQQTFPQ